MKITVQHDPLPSGFKEVSVTKPSDQKLGMVIKGGLQGQPGNPKDQTDEGKKSEKYHNQPWIFLNTLNISFNKAQAKLTEKVMLSASACHIGVPNSVY